MIFFLVGFRPLPIFGVKIDGRMGKKEAKGKPAHVSDYVMQFDCCPVRLSRIHCGLTALNARHSKWPFRSLLFFMYRVCVLLSSYEFGSHLRSLSLSRPQMSQHQFDTLKKNCCVCLRLLLVCVWFISSTPVYRLLLSYLATECHICDIV